MVQMLHARSTGHCPCSYEQSHRHLQKNCDIFLLPCYIPALCRFSLYLVYPHNLCAHCGEQVFLFAYLLTTNSPPHITQWRVSLSTPLWYLAFVLQALEQYLFCPNGFLKKCFPQHLHTNSFSLRLAVMRLACSECQRRPSSLLCHSAALGAAFFIRFSRISS